MEEKTLDLIYASLQRLVGLHRQLLDVVRLERGALTQADVRAIQETTLAKQGLIESIRVEETERIRRTGDLGLIWKKSAVELTLTFIAIAIQGRDLKRADQFRSVQNTLTILMKHVSEQNHENKRLVDRSLDHIHQMKRNVLGETHQASDTYNQQGARASVPPGARLISREA